MARMTKKARQQLATHLDAQSHERLVELVTELAEGDVELRNRLLLEAVSAGTGPVDAASYRRSFSDALRSGSAARRDRPRTSGAWARGGTRSPRASAHCWRPGTPRR